jgi:hypothetical protein
MLVLYTSCRDLSSPPIAHSPSFRFPLVSEFHCNCVVSRSELIPYGLDAACKSIDDSCLKFPEFEFEFMIICTIQKPTNWPSGSARGWKLLRARAELGLEFGTEFEYAGALSNYK